MRTEPGTLTASRKDFLGRPVRSSPPRSSRLRERWLATTLALPCSRPSRKDDSLERGETSAAQAVGRRGWVSLSEVKYVPAGSIPRRG